MPKPKVSTPAKQEAQSRFVDALVDLSRNAIENAAGGAE
jgi:hypothetical protein